VRTSDVENNELKGQSVTTLIETFAMQSKITRISVVFSTFEIISSLVSFFDTAHLLCKRKYK
jgi:hypothetical protein